jgi:hypothetical protein
VIAGASLAPLSLPLLLDAQPDMKIDATSNKVSVSMPSFFKASPR